MCGIAGLVFAPTDAPRAKALVSSMCTAMVHRGPDDEGLFAGMGARETTVALGMRRLAIVDVVHGAQPMSSDDGTITLVYNGEIYNAP